MSRLSGTRITARDAWVDRARAERIEGVLQQRGITLKGRNGKLTGPCPACGGDDRFAVHLAKQVFHCRGCSASGGDAISLVQFLDGSDFLHAVETLTGEPPPVDPRGKKSAESAEFYHRADDYDREQHRKAAWLWSQRQPISGTPAEKYLREARGITCALPATLGFLPPRKPGQHPALISAFAIPDEPEPGVVGEPCDVLSVHLTLLKPDGSGKADVAKPKLMIGSPGALPIVLAPTNDLLGLAITEGIEDGLTVHHATGLGAWAAGAAGRMPRLTTVIPSYVEAVTIYAHADKAGQDGARGLASALRNRQIEVVIEGI